LPCAIGTAFPLFISGSGARVTTWALLERWKSLRRGTPRPTSFDFIDLILEEFFGTLQQGIVRSH